MMPNSVDIMSRHDIKQGVLRYMFPEATVREEKKILEALRQAVYEISGRSLLYHGQIYGISLTPAGKAKVINRTTALLGYTEGNPEARHGQT